MGVGRYTPNAAICGDMGWKIPLHRQKMAVMRQWTRLINMEENRTNSKVFMWAKRAAEKRRGCINWCSKLNSWLRVNDMLYLSDIDYVRGISAKYVTKDLDSILKDCTANEWSHDINREDGRHGRGRKKQRLYR